MYVGFSWSRESCHYTVNLAVASVLHFNPQIINGTDRIQGEKIQTDPNPVSFINEFIDV